MGLPRTVRAATLAALAAAAVVLGATPPAAGLHFYLLPGQRRCFTDDLPLNTLIKGEASVSTGKGHMELDVWVITKNGRVLFHRRKTHHGKFSFTTPEHPDVDHSRPRNDEDEDDEMYGVEEDNYQVCIEHQDHPDAVHEAGTKRLVSFKLDHSAAYDPTGGGTVAAKAKDVDGVVRALEDMHHTLLSMKNQLDTLHYREKRLAKANEGTNERVAWYSSVGFVVLLLTGAYQSFYMKRYLTSKKIL